MVSYVCASVDNIPPSALTMTYPFIPSYPTDDPTYTKFKKSVYSLGQALGYTSFSAQQAYDYYKFYINQSSLNLPLNESKIKFDNSLNNFEEKLREYYQALNNLKRMLYKINNSYNDDIEIDPLLL